MEKGNKDMAISKEEIIHIAKLASLNLSEEEIAKYANDMTDILEFAEIVNNLNTDDIKETVGINGEYNVFRKDEVKQSISKEELLKNAPSQDEGMFRIPKVIN
ncbi:MAG: Asp-tRNA(Asn)/Glu-tRNA(Gln) amidotransferase subunit GatC [Clostridia bacterium]|nr:Asp-tRNA(Asn)/Glu-tRNA(Gln) amidotransferase subunit GatC [Clostridia bacterium]